MVLPVRSSGLSMPLWVLTKTAEWRKLRFGKIGNARNGDSSVSHMRRK